MASLFREGAAYASFRPSYPAALFDRVLQFVGPDARRATAVDVATGSGQAARALATRYSRVVALDASADQLAHAARDIPNVEYRLADAHATGLPPGSADLVTVAQALHWFDAPRFYREARRVLAPGGALAAWCYGLAAVQGGGGGGGEGADWALREVYEGLGPWWDGRRRLVERMYEGLEPEEGADFAEVARERLEMAHTVTVDGLVGYVSSWSAFNSYCADRGKEAGAQLLDGFRARVLRAVGDGEGPAELRLVTPIALLLAKGPVPVPVD